MLKGKGKKAMLARAKQQMYENGSLQNKADDSPFNSLKELYLELNKELFDNELPIDLKVVFSFDLNKGRSKSTVYGMCYYSSSGISKRGHRKDCKAVKIEIKPGMGNAETRKTLVHEMCHAYCFNKFSEVGHGQQFWIKMRKCNYPRGHELPSQRDKWSR